MANTGNTATDTNVTPTTPNDTSKEEKTRAEALMDYYMNTSLEDFSLENELRFNRLTALICDGFRDIDEDTKTAVDARLQVLAREYKDGIAADPSFDATELINGMLDILRVSGWLGNILFREIVKFSGSTTFFEDVKQTIISELMADTPYGKEVCRAVKNAITNRWEEGRVLELICLWIPEKTSDYLLREYGNLMFGVHETESGDRTANVDTEDIRILRRIRNWLSNKGYERLDETNVQACVREISLTEHFKVRHKKDLELFLTYLAGCGRALDVSISEVDEEQHSLFFADPSSEDGYRRVLNKMGLEWMRKELQNAFRLEYENRVNTIMQEVRSDRQEDALKMNDRKYAIRYAIYQAISEEKKEKLRTVRDAIECINRHLKDRQMTFFKHLDELKPICLKDTAALTVAMQDFSSFLYELITEKIEYRDFNSLVEFSMEVWCILFDVNSPSSLPLAVRKRLTRAL